MRLPPRVIRLRFARGVVLTLVLGGLVFSGGALADPPLITAPPAQTAEASSPAGAVVSYPDPLVKDRAGNPVIAVCAPGSGSIFALGATTVLCTAVDSVTGQTATATFTVTVQDTTAPSLSLPAAVDAGAASTEGVVVTYSASGADVVDVVVPVTCAPASGSAFPIGSTTVNCTATDSRGNTSTGSFVVTVTLVDAMPPVVTVPADISETTTVPGGKVITFSASASDTVDGSRAATCTPASGSLFPVGTTTVTCTATDASGNTGTASFVVTITLVDTTAPVVSVPAAITAEAQSANGAVVTYTASATDDLDGSLTPACTPESGKTFRLGVTSVTCKATDRRGNVGTATFDVTVRDTAPPRITMPPDVRVEANSQSGAVVSYVVSAEDVVDGPLVPAAIRCTPAAGSTFGLGATEVRCSATDKAGNTGVGGMLVSVVDTTPPVLNAPAPLTVGGPASGVSASDARITSFLASARATDIVDQQPRISTDAPAVFGFGRTLVTFVATDAAGNRSTATSTVTVAAGTPSTPAKAVDVTAPDDVAALRAETGNRKVRLRWRRPKASDFARVQVFRSLNTAGAAEKRVFHGSATTFVDRGLTNGAGYRYVIVSYDKSGNRSTGLAIIATPRATALISPLQHAQLIRPPLFAWIRLRGADYYNLQLFRGTRKVLSVWPTQPRFRLRTTWRHVSRRERLAPGVYQWYVWPASKTVDGVRYGALHGHGTFSVRR